MNEATVNAIDIPRAGLEQPNEQFTTTQDALYLGIPDNDLSVVINERISRANAYWEKLRIKARRETNLNYWLGDQVDRSTLRDDQEKGVDNIIFRNLETMIPMVTARTPEVTVTPTYKNKATRDYAAKVQRMLPAEWEIAQRMQKKVGRGVRNHQLNFVGVYQVGYDPDTKEFWTEEIVATDLVIDKDGKFVGKYIRNQTVADVVARFPGKSAEIARRLGCVLPIPKQVMDSPAEYIECWTDEMVAWKMQDLVLGKAKNPHFDYDGQQVTTADGRVVTVKYNHFFSPKIPFLFLTYFNRGVHIMDDTTLVEQAIGPQDWVNKRKRQIGANADSTNGHWVSSGDYISQEEFDKITGGIDEKIWLENGMPRDGIQKIMGEALPVYIYNDLIDSRSSIDNLMGTHSTTRGEAAGNNTATQDIVQKDQDYGRVDGYIRDGVEQLAADWFEYMYHLHLVYRTDETSVAIPEDDDNETENVTFSQSLVPLVEMKNGDVIPVKLAFRVKQGSTLPKDEAATYAKAKEMKDTLAPFDYFKLVGMPNPRELTKNLFMWQKNPYFFFKDDPDIQMLQQQEQQAAAAAAGAANATLSPQPQIMAGDGPTAQGTANALRAMLEQGA